tara:strand:- start:4567 stop:4902 length:336 start_codon:yes stop_codon:yes gene_type:complete
MNRAIMILKDSLDWNETQIENAKQSINNGCYGQRLADCKKIIEENEQHNQEIEEALEKLMKMNEKDLKKVIVKAVNKGWVFYGEFNTDVAVESVLEVIKQQFSLNGVVKSF